MQSHFISSCPSACCWWWPSWLPTPFSSSLWPSSCWYRRRTPSTLPPGAVRVPGSPDLNSSLPSVRVPIFPTAVRWRSLVNEINYKSMVQSSKKVLKKDEQLGKLSHFFVKDRHSRLDFNVYFILIDVNNNTYLCKMSGLTAIVESDDFLDQYVPFEISRTKKKNHLRLKGPPFLNNLAMPPLLLLLTRPSNASIPGI